jgi:hypothetical protein
MIRDPLNPKKINSYFLGTEGLGQDLGSKFSDRESKIGHYVSNSYVTVIMSKSRILGVGAGIQIRIANSQNCESEAKVKRIRFASHRRKKSGVRFAEKIFAFASLSLRNFFRKKFRFRNGFFARICIPGRRHSVQKVVPGTKNL